MWLARLLSLCLFGRLATKFFLLFLDGNGASEEFIVVCLNGSSFADLFFPTFSLQVMWCDFWATNLPSTTLNSWRLMETFCSLEPRKFWAPFPFPFLSIYVENLLSKQKKFCLIFSSNVVFFLDSRDMSENKDLVSQHKNSQKSHLYF